MMSSKHLRPELCNIFNHVPGSKGLAHEINTKGSVWKHVLFDNAKISATCQRQLKFRIPVKNKSS